MTTGTGGVRGRSHRYHRAVIALEPAPLPWVTALQIGMTDAGVRGGLDRYYADLVDALPAHSVCPQSVVPHGGSAVKRFGDLRRSIGERLADADVVVSHFAPYVLPALDRIRRPLVVHFHGPWAMESAFEGHASWNVAAKRWIERWVYRRGARCIVLSQAFGAIAMREYGVAPEAIRVIPGGVDTARYANDGSRADARRALFWPVDRPTLVTVRRLVRAKGVEHLIDAVALMRHQVPDVLLHVVGAGPLAAELAERARARGIERNVTFAGFVPDERLPLVYRAADLMIVPTRALEGFGLVVVEALASGTPVLVTPVAGLPEVVRDLSPSLVLGGMDAGDLADGIAAALGGRIRLPDGSACRAYARRFDWSTIAARIAAVYREVA